MKQLRFDWSFNFGHVLTSISVVFAMAGGVMAVGQKLGALEQRIETTERAIINIMPKIDMNDRMNATQEEKIAAQSNDIRGIRSDLSDISRRTGALSESVAGMNAKLDTLIQKK